MANYFGKILVTLAIAYLSGCATINTEALRKRHGCIGVMENVPSPDPQFQLTYGVLGAGTNYAVHCIDKPLGQVSLDDLMSLNTAYDSKAGRSFAYCSNSDCRSRGMSPKVK